MLARANDIPEFGSDYTNPLFFEEMLNGNIRDDIKVISVIYERKMQAPQAIAFAPAKRASRLSKAPVLHASCHASNHGIM